MKPLERLLITLAVTVFGYLVAAFYLGAVTTDGTGFSFTDPIRTALSSKDFDESALTTSLLILVGFSILGAVLSSFPRKATRKEDTTFGSARFATQKEIESSGLLDSEGVILGTDEEGRGLRHNGEEHVLILAPTRSGKGVGVVIPTLLTWPESALVFDPRGENFEKTSGFRSTFSRVLYFNPATEVSAAFNPLSEVRLGTHEVSDCQAIADLIVDPDGKGRGDHWTDSAHAFLVASMLHVLYSEEEKSLYGIIRLLTRPGKDLSETLESIRDTKHKEGLPHPVVSEGAQELLNKHFEERTSIISSTLRYLSLYRDPLLQRATGQSDFKVKDLVDSDRPLSLYLAVSPDQMQRLRPLYRLFLSQVIKSLCRELPSREENGRLTRRRLLLMLDEFPAFGRLSFFESALAYIGGYGMKAVLIGQSKNQFDSEYGPRNSLIDNCHIRTFFTPNTIETAEMISRMLGQKTQTYEHTSFSGKRTSSFLGHMNKGENRTSRPLMTPGEVMMLPKEESLIFVGGLPPIRAQKYRYFGDEGMKRRIVAPIPQRQITISQSAKPAAPLENVIGEGFIPNGTYAV